MRRPREREPWAQGTCCGVWEGTCCGVWEDALSPTVWFGQSKVRQWTCVDTGGREFLGRFLAFWTPKNVEPAVQAIDLRYIFILELI